MSSPFYTAIGAIASAIKKIIEGHYWYNYQSHSFKKSAHSVCRFPIRLAEIHVSSAPILGTNPIINLNSLTIRNLIKIILIRLI